LVALPATIGMMILATPILTTLFENGKFTEFDVIMAGRSLIAFAVGVPAFMLVKILASGFYSRMNIKTPVKIAIIAVLSNTILDAILIVPLAHAGLALATALTSSLNAFLLFWLLYRRKIYQPQRGWLKFWTRLLFANGAMGIFLWLANSDLARWVAWGSLSRVWHLGLLGGGAVGIYLLCLAISGLKWKELVLQEK
jgi:putative peptidoglycan lipid II flippase